jgi:microcystin-dependent protein
MANFKIGQDYIVDKNGYAQSYPIGSIVIITSSTIPDGWLLCDGSPINTYTYQELHKNVTNTYGGTAYSAGITDQSGVVTTFNLPPLVVNATYNPSGRYVVSRQSSEPTYPSSFTHVHSNTISYGTWNSTKTHNHDGPYIVSTTNNMTHNHANVSGGNVLNNVTSNSASSRYSSANNTTQYSNDYVHDHGATSTASLTANTSASISHAHNVTVHSTDTVSHSHSTADYVGALTDSGTISPLSKGVYFIIKY